MSKGMTKLFFKKIKMEAAQENYSKKKRSFD